MIALFYLELYPTTLIFKLDGCWSRHGKSGCLLRKESTCGNIPTHGTLTHTRAGMRRLLSSTVASRDAPIVKFTKRVHVTFKRLLNVHNSVPLHAI